MNTQYITDTEPPALYFVFLWWFWSRLRVISSEEYMYYDGEDVREWLRWLKSLVSHPLSRRILTLMTSKSVETYLSELFLRECDEDLQC